MTPWQNREDDLTRRMADDMKLRNYSQKTIDTYTYHVGKFAKFLGKSPLDASPEDVRSFHKGSALDPVSLPLGTANPLTLFATVRGQLRLLKTEN